jgi:4-amino-4-deoxy-L-arabinose transferase-like glycosyltransferase
MSERAILSAKTSEEIPSPSRGRRFLAFWAGPRGGLATILLIAAAAASIYFYGLGEGDLKDWDESVYATRALAIHEFGGQMWLDQVEYSWLGYYSGAFPPLLPWTSAAMFRLTGGPSEFAHRFCSTLMGASGVVALAMLALQLRGRLAAALSALGLLSVLFYTEYARRGQFDIWFISFDLWAFLFYARAQAATTLPARRRELLVCGAALGLSGMSKIVIGVIIFIGVIAPVAVWRIAARRARWRDFAAEIGWVGLAALVIWAPWHIYMTLTAGRLFWDFYIGFHVLQRSSQVVDHHQQDYLFYFLMAWQDVLTPILGLAACGVVAGIVLGARELWRRGSLIVDESATPWRPFDLADAYVFGAWALIVPAAIYTLSLTKRDTYFLPMVPPLALLAGMFAADFAERPQRGFWRRAAILWFFATLAVWSRSRSDQQNFQTYWDDPASPPVLSKEGLELLAHFWERSVLGGLAIVAGLAALAWGWARWRQSDWRRAFRIASASMLIGSLALFCLRETRSALDIDRGRRRFGWQEMAPLIRDRGSYSEVLFFSSYHEPAKCFYLYGADSRGGWLGARPMGLIECRQTTDWNEFQEHLAQAENPLILFDWYFIHQLPPQEIGAIRHLAGSLARLEHSNQLTAFAKPGSRLAQRRGGS